MPRHKINEENLLMLTSNKDKHGNDDDDNDGDNIGDNRWSGNNWQRSFFHFGLKGNFDGNLSKSFIYK